MKKAYCILHQYYITDGKLYSKCMNRKIKKSKYTSPQCKYLVFLKEELTKDNNE